MKGRVVALALREEHLGIMREEARVRWPMEACGFLLGLLRWELHPAEGEGGVAVVKEVMMVRNALESSVSFEIDPLDTLRAYKRAEELGLEVIGIYHSHPAPAEPSPTDLRYMRLNPLPWAILSMPSLELGAWIWDDGPKRLRLYLL